jgi:hypothetical protein
MMIDSTAQWTIFAVVAGVSGPSTIGSCNTSEISPAPSASSRHASGASVTSGFMG